MQRYLQWFILCGGLCCVGCSSLTTDPGSLLYRFRNRDTVHERETLLMRQATEALEQRQWDMAEGRYCEILQLNPQNEAAINNLGRVYYDQGKYYLAALRFNQALEISTDPAVQLNHLGLVQEASGRWPAAEAYYQQAIQVNPDCVVYQAHLARVFVRQERRDLEVEALLEAVVAKDDRPGWREWARLQLTKIRDRNRRDAEESRVVGGNGAAARADLMPDESRVMEDSAPGEIGPAEERFLGEQEQIPLQ